MQSPTDLDATFRTKYDPNIGYVANVAEHYDKNHCVIEYYDYQKNVYSDISFSEDAVEKLHSDNLDQSESNKMNPINLVVDAAYYGHDLAKETLNKGVKLYPTDLVGKNKVQIKWVLLNSKLIKKVIVWPCVLMVKNGQDRTSKQ